MDVFQHKVQRVFQFIIICKAAGMEDKLDAFIVWLRDHGATYDKIDWPVTNENTGCVRGAIAKDDIHTNESMLNIPIQLMLTPEGALRDPEIGAILSDNRDILRGDLLLTIYLMHEVLKKENSFYYPYLQILPEPHPLTQWTDSELSELQDEGLEGRVRTRRRHLEYAYQRSILQLRHHYPSTFSTDRYTMTLFLFAWNTVQARAFGKRLPWTALVPFADCLNHANVQTKYDYDKESNGLFRLYPTGTNSYAKGTEVFNSYGRRHNENLLMDYGFAMKNNEWDRVYIDWKWFPDDVAFRFEARHTAKIKLAFNLWCSDVMFPLRMYVFGVPYSFSDVERNERYFTPITLCSEHQVLFLLLSALLQYEQHYPTSAADDENLLLLDNISDSYRSAIIYRLTRKNIVSLNIITIKYILEWMRTLAGVQDHVEGQLQPDNTLFPSDSEKQVMFSNLITVCRAGEESELFKYLECLNDIDVI